MLVTSPHIGWCLLMPFMVEIDELINDVGALKTFGMPFAYTQIKMSKGRDKQFFLLASCLNRPVIAHFVYNCLKRLDQCGEKIQVLHRQG